MRKEEKDKYQGDRFSFHYEETLTLTKIESRENQYSLKWISTEFRLLKIALPILTTAFSKRSAQFRYNTSINTRETLWP